MAKFDDVALKKFCANTIAKENMPTPIKVELLDIGMNPLHEMVANIDQGTCKFSDERRLSRATPSGTVRFTHGKDCSNA